MPDHLHLILPASTAKPDRLTLRGALGALSKQAGVPGLWQPIASPLGFPNLLHLRRGVRYLALNPCRDRLCRDPLEWPWSTYRDVMGASASPWITAERLMKGLREPKGVAEFRIRFHAQVSGDPSVAVQGTPAPRGAALPRRLAWHSLGQVALAACAALRLPVDELQRRRSRVRPLLVHFARRQGWDAATPVAMAAGCTPHGVRKIWSKPEPQGMEAAALCLGDRRFSLAFELPQA